MQQLPEDQTPDIENRKRTIYPSARYSSGDNTLLCSACSWIWNDHFYFAFKFLPGLKSLFSDKCKLFTSIAEARLLLDHTVCLYSISCTQQTYYIILSFVFTIKSMGSKLRKIKGHHVCHFETLLSPLLTHPEKGHTIIYLIPPPPCLLLAPAAHPQLPPYAPTHPASRAMNTLRGLRAVLWTTCALFTWLSRQWVRETGTLKPNRCMIQRRELWRVNFLYKAMLLLEQTAAWSCPRKHLHASWLFPLISQTAFLLFHGMLIKGCE